MNLKIRSVALACALALPFVAALAPLARPALAAGDKDKKADPEGDLKKALGKKDKAGVIAAMKACSAEGDEKAAQLILTIALSPDLDKLFKAEDSNDIFDAAEEALGAIKDPKAESFIFDQLHKHRDVRVRVFLVDVVAKRKGDAAEAALIGALDDKSTMVQKPVFAHLGLKKSVKGIDPAIAILAKTEKKREDPWLDALRYLTTLTGKDLATAEEWKGWWTQAKGTFDPAKVAPPKTGSAGVGETVTRGAPELFGTEVLSKRCVFILDVSGSMNIKDTAPPEKGKKGTTVTPKDPSYGEVPDDRKRMTRLKDAMVKLIKELPGDTKFTIITFATSVRDWQRNLVEASAGNKEDAVSFAEGMQPEGFTVTDEALRAAFDVPDANTFYLFSDGIPQRGKKPDGSPDHIDTKEILEEVEQMNRTRKVKIFTIGIGEADPKFMRALAVANGGTFTAVE